MQQYPATHQPPTHHHNRSGRLLDALVNDSRCLASLLRFYDPGRADDWQRLGAVCAALGQERRQGG